MYVSISSTSVLYIGYNLTNGVTTQDSSPPSVVRKRFLLCGFAARGLQSHIAKEDVSCCWLSVKIATGGSDQEVNPIFIRLRVAARHHTSCENSRKEYGNARNT